METRGAPLPRPKPSKKQQRKFLGLCPCGAKPSGKFVYCDSCRDKQKAAKKRLAIKRRKQGGVCLSCGAKASEELTLCDRCLEKKRKKRIDLKNSGCCPKCSAKSKDGITCDRCKINMTKRRVILNNPDIDFNSESWKDYIPDNKPKDHWPERSCIINIVECFECGKLFTARNGAAKYCSKECRTKGNYNKQRIALGISLHVKKCSICGDSFETYRSTQHCCRIESCIDEQYRDHKRNAKHKRRVWVKNGFVESINLSKLFHRDSGRCQICGRKLNLKRTVPHPLSATIDHIIPLSCDGTHEYKNVQLACFKCNSLKGNRSVSGGEQLLLFG